MIETRLGELEGVILLLVGILGKEAYAFNIAEDFERGEAYPLEPFTQPLHGWKKKDY